MLQKKRKKYKFSLTWRQSKQVSYSHSWKKDQQMLLANRRKLVNKSDIFHQKNKLLLGQKVSVAPYSEFTFLSESENIRA